MAYHVAVDLGASSGRIILADTRKDLKTTDIHRFKNGFTKINGHDRWDVTRLVQEVITGLKKVKEAGVTTCTLGIDTWGIDYVLLNKEGKLLANPIAYRDKRTQGVMEKVFSRISKEKIYQKTGIQFMAINTLYQLYAEDRDLLKQAAHILMIPDYIAYCLTGKITQEVTNCSTTQYLNIHTRTYDQELLEGAGASLEQMPDLIEAGTVIGPLSPELSKDPALPEVEVIATTTHDTASAVVGVPATKGSWAYISSGTWSLMGVENQEPVLSPEAFEANYTNEWGAYHTYRFLKNIAGMWPIQEITRLSGYKYTYVQMAQMAAQVQPFLQYINLTDDRFTNPDNMIEEIQQACRETHQTVPQTIGELVMCVYSNLALAYGYEWKTLEKLIGRPLDVLHIVGGGSNVRELNQLTANIIGKPVIAGPGEATALGNILVQMITTGELDNLQQARSWLASGLNLECFEPQPMDNEKHLARYQKIALRKENI